MYGNITLGAHEFYNDTYIYNNNNNNYSLY